MMTRTSFLGLIHKKNEKINKNPSFLDACIVKGERGQQVFVSLGIGKMQHNR